MLRPEIEALLLELAHKHYQGAELADELDAKLEAAYPAARPAATSRPAPPTRAPWPSWPPGPTRPGRRDDRRRAGRESAAEDARARCVNALDAKHRPEMREMEKVLLLQILDASWMEHLRAMDHLRSSIGLQGYAQIDPKVEYKREGMRIFAEMWNGIADRATDLIFRVEQFDPEFLSYLGSRWKLDRAQTIHQSAESQLAAVRRPPAGIRRPQDAAIAGSQQSTEKKKEPVRNVGKKVGRNDPCPCGSGKKVQSLLHAEASRGRSILIDSTQTLLVLRRPQRRFSSACETSMRASLGGNRVISNPSDLEELALRSADVRRGRRARAVRPAGRWRCGRVRALRL